MNETIKNTKEMFELIKKSEQAKEEAKKLGIGIGIIFLIGLAAIK